MVNLSRCESLFGNPASKVFTHIKASNVNEIVEDCLEVSMRICSHLFEDAASFRLFTTTLAGNEACALYTLRIVQIKKSYHLKSMDEKLEFSEPNRFILLSLFLSEILSKDITKFFYGIFNKTIQTNKIKVKNRVKFKAFVMDQGSCLNAASKAAYNVLFENYLKKVLAESDLNDPVFKELYQLSQENLELNDPKRVQLYTFPISGLLLYVAQQLKNDNITVIVRVKVITERGVEGYLSKKLGSGGRDEPAYVLNAIAGSYSVPFYRKEGVLCPKNFFRTDHARMHHAPEKKCFNCAVKPGGIAPFQKKLNEALQNLQEFFSLLGADNANSDKRFSHFFNDKSYPKLSQLFREKLARAQELGLRAENPQGLSVVTAHANLINVEEEAEFFLDQTAEAIAQKILNNKKVI